MFKFLKSNFLANKKVQLSIAVILSMVVLLIAFSGQEKTNANETKNQEETTAQSYEEDVENRIENIINSISGISGAKAFVYTKSSIEIIYAEDIDKKLSGNESNISAESQTVVFSKDGSKTSAVVIKKIYPEIEGVLVVAKGADDEKKRIMIINALASVLGINIGSIEVLAG